MAWEFGVGIACNRRCDMCAVPTQPILVESVAAGSDVLHDLSMCPVDAIVRYTDFCVDKEARVDIKASVSNTDNLAHMSIQMSIYVFIHISIRVPIHMSICICTEMSIHRRPRQCHPGLPK